MTSEQNEVQVSDLQNRLEAMAAENDRLRKRLNAMSEAQDKEKNKDKNKERCTADDDEEMAEVREFLAKLDLEDASLANILKKLSLSVGVATNDEASQKKKRALVTTIMNDLDGGAVERAVDQLIDHKLHTSAYKKAINPTYAPITDIFGTKQADDDVVKYGERLLKAKKMTSEDGLTVETAFETVKETFAYFKGRDQTLSENAVEVIIRMSLPNEAKRDFIRHRDKGASLGAAWTSVLNEHGAALPPRVARKRLADLSKDTSRTWKDTLIHIKKLAQDANPSGEGVQSCAVEAARDYFATFLEDPVILQLFQPAPGSEDDEWASLRANALSMQDFLEDKRKVTHARKTSEKTERV